MGSGYLELSLLVRNGMKTVVWLLRPDKSVGADKDFISTNLSAPLLFLSNICGEDRKCMDELLKLFS